MAKMKESRRSTPVIEDDGTFPEEVVEDRMEGLSVVEVLRKPVMITTLLNSVKRDPNLFGWIESVAHTPKRADTIPHQAKLRA